MGKRVIGYESSWWRGASSDPIGRSVTVFTAEHPYVGPLGLDYGVNTSPVVAYDETTGIIETDNTVYVPN